VNILAFDTSTEYLSLALLKGGETFHYDCNAGQTHSQIILPQIQTLLDSANLQLSDLQGIAFGAGPGSFTGVRIAAGVAQGLG
jgi:tRNA threonylcarbamoyladenosine biosynthesis protein TsaB